MAKASENGMMEAILRHAQDKDEERSLSEAWFREACGEEIKTFFVTLRYSAQKTHLVKTLGVCAYTEYDAKQLTLFFCKRGAERSAKKSDAWKIVEVTEAEEGDVVIFSKKNKREIITVNEKDYHALLCFIKMGDKDDLLNSCQELKDILS